MFHIRLVMKNKTSIAIFAAALTLASITDFLDVYAVEVQAEENQIQLFGPNGEKQIAFRDLMNPNNTEKELENLFTWLAPNNVEGVITDWNYHCERETGETIPRPSLADRIGSDW
jgi:hypothetical protein